jgi:ATP-dependent helicase/nuclease subunit A
VRLTTEQERVVGADGSVAVIAGAGTGKTLMLAARYLHHILHHGLSPLNVVAVTFTDKAAAELRARTRREVAAHPSISAELQAELEAAQISTLHALAARICREHPEAAGVAPDFVILDELEGRLWMVERLEQALADLPSRIFDTVPHSLTRSAMEAFLADPIAADRALSSDPENWPLWVAETRNEALVELEADRSWREGWANLQTITGGEGDKIEVARQVALAARAALQEQKDLRVPLEALVGIKLLGGSQKNWPEGGLDEVKAALTTVRSLSTAALKKGLIVLELGPADNRLAAMLPALRQAFQQVRDHLGEAKRRARVLDFADLEVHALRALENADVQAYYHNRWKAFLVDEFQDTNPVQADLLERLTQGALLTVVGDEKQSIYGFRRADATVFRKVRRRIAESGCEQVLSTSFRSHDSLVQMCNGLFSPLLEELHQALHAQRTEPPHPGPHLRAWVVQAAAGTSKPQRQVVEARHIARMLKEMLDTQVLVHDRATDRLRPVCPGDIAILSRAWEPLDTYGAALEAVGIPTVHAGGGDLLSTREAKDGWVLLRFLSDPADDLALAAVLRSPFFAVSDRTLFTFAQSLPGKTTWWSLLREADTPELLRPSWVLDELLQACRIDPPSRLLQVADRLTGYTAVIANLPGAARREADWRGFLACVRNLERGSVDLFGLVRRLKRLLAAQVEVPRPPLEAGDAVALMTIHGAKGLEWSIVVVPDLTRSAPSNTDPVRFDPDLGVAVKVRGETGETQKPALFTLLECRQKDREEAEARRVLYVALTRARDHLILSATEEKGAGLDLLLPGLHAVGARPQPILFTPEDAQPPSPTDPDLPTRPSRLLTSPLGPGLFELPATALAEYACCPQRFHFRFVEGHPGLGEGEASARRIGTLAHVALERNIRDVDTLSSFDPTLDPARTEEALWLALRFESVPAFAQVRSSGGLRERPVLLRRGGLTLHGVVDLLGREFVLDYKTDQEIAPKYHQLQLWVYAQATDRKTAHLAYLRHDYLHTLDAEELKAIGRQADLLIEGLLAGDHPARPSPEACACCPYAAICEERHPSPSPADSISTRTLLLTR